MQTETKHTDLFLKVRLQTPAGLGSSHGTGIFSLCCHVNWLQGQCKKGSI